ncbi:MAG: hypothetical protein LDLANPLL_00639 [Turneriella sp.]|nr:hypothetical protein [Turneriella sp.]
MFFGNCAKTTEDTKITDFCGNAESKRQELLNLDNERSCSTVTDCQSASYGRGCTGFGVTGYVIYSKLKVTDSQVQQKIAEYNQLEDQCAAKATGHICPAVVVLEPTLACVLSICIDMNP